MLDVGLTKFASLHYATSLLYESAIVVLHYTINVTIEQRSDSTSLSTALLVKAYPATLGKCRV
jgi:hypothetical protein